MTSVWEIQQKPSTICFLISAPDLSEGFFILENVVDTPFEPGLRTWNHAKFSQTGLRERDFSGSF